MNERLPDHVEEEESKLSDRQSVNMDLFFWLQAAVTALVVLILVFTFVVRIVGVSGDSMVPTLHNRDMMLVRCIGYTPKQGDVVVLTKEFDAADGPIVKRVIAVGGQTVDIDYASNTVYVDGKALDEPYINEHTLQRPLYENATHAEVPKGSVFVLGDNRNHSADSRDVTLGAVDERYIIGHVFAVIFPFSDFGAIR